MGFYLGVPQLAFGFICITIGSRTTPSTTIGLLMLTETLFAPVWVWLFLLDTSCKCSNRRNSNHHSYYFKKFRKQNKYNLNVFKKNIFNK